jgi:hypothetical protein
MLPIQPSFSFAPGTGIPARNPEFPRFAYLLAGTQSREPPQLFDSVEIDELFAKSNLLGREDLLCQDCDSRPGRE